MRDVLLDLAREHAERARAYERLAAERLAFSPRDELIERAHEERIKAERAQAVAAGIAF